MIAERYCRDHPRLIPNTPISVFFKKNKNNEVRGSGRRLYIVHRAFSYQAGLVKPGKTVPKVLELIGLRLRFLRR